MLARLAKHVARQPHHLIWTISHLPRLHARRSGLPWRTFIPGPMADGDERRVPAADERCRGAHDEIVVANGLDERVVISGPVTVGRGGASPLPPTGTCGSLRKISMSSVSPNLHNAQPSLFKKQTNFSIAQ